MTESVPKSHLESENTVYQLFMKIPFVCSVPCAGTVPYSYTPLAIGSGDPVGNRGNRADRSALGKERKANPFLAPEFRRFDFSAYGTGYAFIGL